MRYYGGKAKYGKQISEEIIKLLSLTNNLKEYIYLEPFCGALGVLRHLTKYVKKSYANDLCKDLIMLWKEVQNKKFKNPSINHEKWLKLKNDTKSSAERAFAGFGCSFSGVWFNGYVNDNDMQYSSIKKIENLIEKTVFSSMNYIDFLKRRLNTKDKFLIYLDPPYKNTECHPWTRQGSTFDNIEFWKIVEQLSKMKNVILFISEFHAPKQYKKVYSFARRSGMHNTSSNKMLTENLYCNYNNFHS